ncbi:MAG: T9SS type A sorting domain-containing protein [Bacteroidales bacterium]|nr:T9SS type A sorting domain-containing protein [Bacteroidales bacterium]
MKTIALILAFLTFFISNIYATDYSSVSDGNWALASTWDVGGTYPNTISDNADIANNDSIWLANTGIKIKAGILTFNQNSILYIPFNDTLEVDSISILNNAFLYVEGTLIVINGVNMINNSGLNIDLTGNISVGGDFTGSNNVDLIVDGAIDVAGDFTLGNGSTIEGDGSITVEGTIDVPDGADPGGVLPIELIVFYVVQNFNSAIIKWSTASEINNDYFTIEKSVNGVDFETVEIYPGAGNSNVINNYQITDFNPYSGISYYRLKQTDFDGNYSYSDVFSFNYNLTNTQLKLTTYPNPALVNENINIKIEGISSTEMVELRIINQTGVLVYSKQLFVSDINMNNNIELANNLEKGIYFLIIQTSNNYIYKKIIVK